MSSPNCLNHALRRDELSPLEQKKLPAMRVNPSEGRLPRRAKDDERLRQAAVSVLGDHVLPRGGGVPARQSG